MVHEVKYKRIVPEAKLPTLATNGASGYDVYLLTVLDRETKAVISNLELPAEILPGESVLFGTGIALEIPPYLHAAVLSRTGLAVKHNIEVGYSGAIIDSDYRGEITILPDHLPLVTLTKPGLIRIFDNGGKKRIIDFSMFGFLEVKPEDEGIILLAE